LTSPNLRLTLAGFRGQISAIVLLGLVLSQLLAALLYWDLTPRWRRELRPESAISSISLVTHLLDSAPPRERAAYSASLSGTGFRVRWDAASASSALAAEMEAADIPLRDRIAQAAGKPADAVQVQAAGSGPDDKRVTVRLRDDTTLEVRTAVGGEYRLGIVEQAAIGTFFLLVFGGLWIWITWMVNAPLLRFANTAERVGRDIRSAPLEVQGPAELRRVIQAFNDMQLRLRRMVDDRTLMLGAIGHDLRTPLTRLRLRMETGRPDAGLAHLLAEIESMETMLKSALAFIRGVDDGESGEIVDFDQLLQTVCDAVADLGGVVHYRSGSRLHLSCRPNALMRALTNVVGNAVKYGGEARVSLANLGHEIEVRIEDSGPGIPDAEKSRVFEPFYRRPQTLALDSAGLGLGLSIARSIVLAHGGRIELEDAAPQGLRAIVALPRGNIGEDLLAPRRAATVPPMVAIDEDL
jgi:two-component system, OmpR family, sensor kinase